jgi:GGDEF domain-containing protein
MKHASFSSLLNKRLALAMLVALLLAMVLTMGLSVSIVWLMLGEQASFENLVSFDVSILTIPFFLLMFVVFFYFTQNYFTQRFVKEELVIPLNCIADEINQLRLDKPEGEEDRFTHRDNLVLEVDEIYKALITHIGQFQSIYHKFDALMITDHKTGLLRREHMDSCVRQEVFLSERYHRAFSITLVNLIRMNVTNLSKDEALASFTSKLREVTRNADSVFYINDKLFVIVSPETDEQGVMALQQSLNQRFAEHLSDTGSDYQFELASATYGEADGLNYKELIAAAKKRLQQKLKLYH